MSQGDRDRRKDRSCVTDTAQRKSNQIKSWKSGKGLTNKKMTESKEGFGGYKIDYNSCLLVAWE